jgi:hypothetical protein
MHDGVNSPADGDGAFAIADVSDTPLSVLFASDDSALAGSIRILLEIDSEGENYAAHNSSV